MADDRLRRSMYGIVLTQGRRNDLARFVNGQNIVVDGGSHDSMLANASWVRDTVVPAAPAAAASCGSSLIRGCACRFAPN